MSVIISKPRPAPTPVSAPPTPGRESNRPAPWISPGTPNPPIKARLGCCIVTLPPMFCANWLALGAMLVCDTVERVAGESTPAGGPDTSDGSGVNLPSPPRLVSVESAAPPKLPAAS